MTVLDVAIVAGNFALLPEEEQAQANQELGEAFDTEEARDVFEFLLERKEELYGANRRVIVDYSIRRSGNKLKFNVVSTPELDVWAGKPERNALVSAGRDGVGCGHESKRDSRPHTTPVVSPAR